MNIFNFLFEQQSQNNIAKQKTEKEIGDLLSTKDNKKYAICVLNNNFTLYDVEKLLEIFKEKGDNFSIEDFTSFVASWMQVREPELDGESPCLGAYQIAFQARNPDYPKAGQVLTKLVSAWLKAPLTGDRKLSNSPSAKKMWSNIEHSSDVKQVTLDNFYDDFDDGKQYFQKKNGNLVKGQSITPNDTFDDCITPGGYIGSVERFLGTDKAMQAVNISVESFRKNHEIAKKIANEKLSLSSEIFERELVLAGEKWFYHF